QLGSDVVGVVDACSRARATARMLAGGPRQGALSKRIGRAERVARLHNPSADVLIANVAAPVREQQRSTAAWASTSWPLCTRSTDVVRSAEVIAFVREGQRRALRIGRWQSSGPGPKESRERRVVHGAWCTSVSEVAARRPGGLGDQVGRGAGSERTRPFPTLPRCS